MPDAYKVIINKKLISAWKSNNQVQIGTISLSHARAHARGNTCLEGSCASLFRIPSVTITQALARNFASATFLYTHSTRETIFLRSGKWHSGIKNRSNWNHKRKMDSLLANMRAVLRKILYSNPLHYEI